MLLRVNEWELYTHTDTHRAILYSSEMQRGERKKKLL
jgi:hypothetical protein